MTVVVTNLTAFTRYFVTITAFTGPLEQAASDGKAIGPIEFQTLEEGMWKFTSGSACDSCCPPVNMNKYLLIIVYVIISTLSLEPRDPPKNVVVSVIPEEVNSVKVTFTPPEEPNGNITAYFVYVYEKDQLVKNISLNITKRDQNMMTAVIEGLKGGHSYSIQVYTHTEVTQVVLIAVYLKNSSFLSVVFLPFFYLSVCRFQQRTGLVGAHPAHTSRLLQGSKVQVPLLCVCALHCATEFPSLLLQQCGLDWCYCSAHRKWAYPDTANVTQRYFQMCVDDAEVQFYFPCSEQWPICHVLHVNASN